MKKFSKTLLVISLAALFIAAAGCQKKEITNPSNNIGTNSSQPSPSNSESVDNPPRIIKTSGKVELVETERI